MPKFITRLNKALNEAHNRLVSIPKSIYCQTCSTNHLYYSVEVDKRQVAIITRTCDLNTHEVLGWKVEYSSDIYGQMEDQHDILDAGQTAEQETAPYKTAAEALKAVSDTLKIPIQPSAVERRNNAFKHVKGPIDRL